jgi:chemotaxis protein methyltransferase CheR
MDAGEIFEMELDLLVQAIFQRYQYDFRNYSRSSLRRRLAKALDSLGYDTLSQLQGRLLREPSLFLRLLDYLTVPTTEMFRDPGYFAALRQHALPYLRTFPSLKIWIAGCSTGEELYSMAILLKEEGLLDKTVLYATDINPSSIETARQGIYTAEAVRKASTAYQAAGGHGSLSDHYQAAYESVRFDPELVEHAVFADHSLATDAVFAEVHLISCRNVLIYFDKELQDRAFGLFRDALVRQGFLGLGSKETIHFSRHRDAFDVICRDERVFQKR